MFNRKLFISLVYFLSVLLISINSRVEAAKVHAIVIGDTMEGGTIDLSTEFSLDMIQREIKRIAIYTDMDLDMAVFEGYYVTQKNIVEYFEQLNVASDDIIILACIAHGSRDAQKANKWPDMRFTLDWAFNQPRTDFGYFIELLQNKKPRLLFAFDESCNEIRKDETEALNCFEEEDEEEKTLTPEEKQRLYERTARKGPTYRTILDERVDHIRHMAEGEYVEQYRKLFLETAGSILTSSSSPGQTSYREFKSTGSLYTCEFFKALHEAVSMAFVTGEDANWKIILDTAVLKTEQHPYQGDHVQIPQYELLMQ